MNNWLIPIRIEHAKVGTMSKYVTYRTLYLFFLPVARWSTVTFGR
jgi:hypothetical protein